MDLISVIVPVYKVEKYLDRCVESIVNQTYKNLEIILVDDGSPDNCPAMCDAWAKKDSRIKVIHKENGGLSDARNAGMRLASGEYICFVDSDDWMDRNTEMTIDKIISRIGNRQSVIVLQHDLYVESVNAVETVIKWGLENGYKFMPLTTSSPACEQVS